jgi:hypothetical protein
MLYIVVLLLLQYAYTEITKSTLPKDKLGDFVCAICDDGGDETSVLLL